MTSGCDRGDKQHVTSDRIGQALIAHTNRSREICSLLPNNRLRYIMIRIQDKMPKTWVVGFPNNHLRNDDQNSRQVAQTACERVEGM
jgi:hypothetical protein